MLLSVIIPTQNEEECLEETIVSFKNVLTQNNIPHEILVVDDYSFDNTQVLLEKLKKVFSNLEYIKNDSPRGFGNAIKKGLMEYKGDVVAIVMADGSDSPHDLVKYYNKIITGYDCVFGSRFIKGGQVIGYPKIKFVMNRVGNLLIRKVFGLPYDDITNAFKCYRRSVIERVKPILSNHFNITVELPIKAIIYGFSYTVVPNSWTNRKHGVSKLNLRRMLKQYLLIVLFLWLNKYISES